MIVVAMYLLKVIVLAIAGKLASCRSYGASPGSCVNMEPGHFTISNEHTEAQKTASPYTLVARWDKGMKMIRLSVTGDSFRGFLIQGRNEISGPAIGNFVNITENPEVAYQNCNDYTKFGNYASITHTSRTDKENVIFYWEPPKTFTKKGTVTFYATLAKRKNTYWTFQKSNMLPLNMEYAKDYEPTTSVPPTNQERNRGSNAASVVLSTNVVFLITFLAFLISKNT